MPFFCTTQPRFSFFVPFTSSKEREALDIIRSERDKMVCLQSQIFCSVPFEIELVRMRRQCKVPYEERQEQKVVIWL